MDNFLNLVTTQGEAIFGSLWPLVWALVRIVIIVLPMFGAVAYMTLWERKLIGWMHIRLGPNRVGPLGLLQPIADALKLLMKEIISPTRSSKVLYFIAPVMVIMPAFAAWAVIPFQAKMVLADVNAGLLYVMAISSIGVYGVILAGWSSNSKYPFLGAMRASAQMISYEIAMGFALVTVLLTSGSLNLSSIVASQEQGYFAGMGLNFLSWNWLPLLPMFVIYFISGVAETNRHPFDVVEGESEIVAGHMVEYSGMAFAMFFLAEYANMILIAALSATMFLGGWLPIVDLPILRDIPGFFWLFAKTFFLLSCV
ncbi:MAG: NADH-quinone oxidoreductase subunit H, partial [Polynucleobacter sp. 24-46-87]